MKTQLGLLLALVIINIKAGAQSGLDQQRLGTIDQFIEKQIAEKHIPGGVALIMKNGQVVYEKAFGKADVETNKAMQTNSIFRLASQSKAITSLGVMMLWEEGKFLLDDPISKYLPAFKNPRVLVSFNARDSTYTTRPASREITVRDLLRHTSGIAYSAVFSDPVMQAIYKKAGMPSGIGTTKGTIKEMAAVLAKQPLQHDPGAAFTYGQNTDLLGFLIEIWSEQPLDQFLQQRIFDPLEMKDTYFHVPAEKQSRVVSLYESENEQLLPVKHLIYEGVDPNFPKLHGTYLSGGAGLSGTVDDYVKFLSLFLNQGTYKGKRLVSRKTIEYMLTNNLPAGTKSSPFPAQPDDIQFGLSGFAIETEQNDYLSPLSVGSFRWEGAFSTYGWGDPKEQLIGLFFTQEYLSPWWRIGEEFRTLTYSAISN